MAVASATENGTRDRERAAMIVAKRAPQRTVIRGLGSMLALPLLDSMMPRLGGAEDRRQTVNRSGSCKCNGMIMKNYLPLTEGADYEPRRH
jgi:hypothetical protein